MFTKPHRGRRLKVASGTSGGVVWLPHGPYGVNGGEIYFDLEALPWAWEDGDDIVIDVTNSVGAVRECGDDLVVDA